MNPSDIIANAFSVFVADVTAAPSISLRCGNALDDYADPLPFDPTIDAISDRYLEAYHWGISYLDAGSWRHYLPHLIEYSFRHLRDGSLAVESLLNSLRPPDRDPPRLASLNVDQEAAVAAFLDCLAFGEESSHEELACQVLQEWWTPGALYRGQ